MAPWLPPRVGSRKCELGQFSHVLFSHVLFLGQKIRVLPEDPCKEETPTTSHRMGGWQELTKS